MGRNFIVFCPVCAIDEYANAGVGPTTFKTRTDHITRGIKACRCSRYYIWTLSEIEYRAIKIASGKGREFIRVDGHDLPRKKWRVIYSCETHGEISSSMSNFFFFGARCAICTRKGFRDDLDGYVYCLLSRCEKYMKVGISNFPDNRIKLLSGRTPFQFDVRGVYKCGDAREVERSAHSDYESAGLSGFDGCTEWLMYDPAILKHVEERAI